MTSTPPDSPLHIHVAGWSGTSHSIALVNQWQALALSKRPDVRLSKEDIAAPFSPDEVFSSAERARLDSLPSSPALGVPDAELRTPFFTRAQQTRHPVLAFVVSELLGGVLRQKLPSQDEADRIELLYYTVPSRWVRDGLLEQGIRETQVGIVPHGVQTSIFRPSQAMRHAVRRQLGLKRFTFMNAGALVRVKGQAFLLKALAVLLQRGLPVQLVMKAQERVYGKLSHVPGAAEILSDAEADLVNANIVYIGQSLDMASMAALYNACDAYVAPYRAEGFCLPVLEAAACGLPIIATAGGPTDDFTTDDFRWAIRSKRWNFDEHSYGLEPDLDHLIELMARMVTARDFHNRASKAGPRHVAANYTWDHVAGRIVEIVRGLN